MHELAIADGWVTDSDIQILQNSYDVCTMSVHRGGDMAFGEKVKNFKDWWKANSVIGDQPREHDLIEFKSAVVKRAAANLEMLDRGFREAARSLPDVPAREVALSALIQMQDEQKAAVIKELVEMLDSAAGEFVSMLMEEGNDDKKDAAALTTQDYVSNQ